jgi:glutamate carboxypeptidase
MGVMLDLLKRMALLESPSTQKDALDRCGEALQAELSLLGADLQVFAQAAAGNHIAASWPGSVPGPGFLILCHMDTVWEVGTLASMPLREVEGRLYGPGVLDMKGGIAVVLAVLGQLQEQDRWPARPVTVLLTSDEEVGSLTSRALIEEQARSAGLVLCMEPALANGALKTARKGTGDILLTARGRAAHAGGNHEQGRNAIEELAHHILAAQRLTDYSRGTTANVGLVSGGTRPNVVPAEARAVVDIRVVSMDEAARLDAWVKEVRPVLEGTSIEASFTLDRPPMPRSAILAASFEQARAIGRTIGLELKEGSTGGGSDANFVAALGIPVLDGLGPVGEGAHSPDEHVVIASLPERAALLAALLTKWEF